MARPRSRPSDLALLVALPFALLGGCGATALRTSEPPVGEPTRSMAVDPLGEASLLASVRSRVSRSPL
jgi:hypothetical protein